MADFKEHLAKEVYRGQKLSLMEKINARYLTPSTNAVYLIRKFQLWTRRMGGKSIGKRVAVIFSRFYELRLVRKYGIFLRGDMEIGMGLRLPHPNSIIIGANAIGKNVTIYQQVTVGSAHIGDYKQHKQPVIGDGSVIFAGSKVIGNIAVAAGTVVAAGAVLTKSAEENGIYVGVPAHLVKQVR